MQGITTNLIDRLPPEISDDSQSSIYYNPQTRKYTYLSPAPPIKNLTMSGGGAKGVILPGVIKAFEDYKVGAGSFRDQLDYVSGSSIGAIQASFLATGVSADHLIEIVKEVDLKLLMGKGLGPFQKNGKPLLNFVRFVLVDSLRKILKSIFDVQTFCELDERSIRNFFMLSDLIYDEALIKEIVHVIEELKKSQNQCRMTFSMLRSVRQLDPNLFKDLTVTATCRENGKTFYFNADNTPDLDIGLACRASASLPVILKPVEIERRLLCPGYADVLAGYKKLTFSDGGFYNNIPVDVLQDKQFDRTNKGKNGQNLQTLVLIFDETKQLSQGQSPFCNVSCHEHELYDSSNLMQIAIRDFAGKLFGGIHSNRRNTVVKEEELEKIRKDYTLRCIPLKVSLETTDFEQSRISAQKYVDRGYKQATEFLENHCGELIARHFDSLGEIADYILSKPPQIERGGLLQIKR